MVTNTNQTPADFPIANKYFGPHSRKMNGHFIPENPSYNTPTGAPNTDESKSYLHIHQESHKITKTTGYVSRLSKMARDVRLTSLGSLTLQSCYKLKTLPRGLGKLGALKQLMLGELFELQEMPDLIGLTALGSLTIQDCYKLKTLPRGLGKLGVLKQLTLWELHELQEMPDLIGLTAA